MRRRKTVHENEMADAEKAGIGKGEKSPLILPGSELKMGPDGTKSGGGERGGGGSHIERSVSWVLLSFLILGEIAGQGVFALPLHLGRLGWL